MRRIDGTLADCINIIAQLLDARAILSMTMPTGSIAMLVYDAEQGSPIEGTPPCRPTPWPRQPSWRGHFFCPSTLGPQPPLPPSITRREGCRSRLGVVASAGAVASARSTSSPTVHRRLPTARLITSSSRTISRGPQSASSAQRRISTIIAKVGGCHARISTRKCRDEFRSAPGSRINAADGNAGLLCRPRSYATSRLRNLGKCAPGHPPFRSVAHRAPRARMAFSLGSASRR